MLAAIAFKRCNSLWLPSRCRMLSRGIPFDLDKDDEQHKSFNNMYVDMFTPKDNSVISQSDSDNSANEVCCELDEINKEMHQLYNIGFDKLTPLELEEVVKSKERFVLQSLSTDPYYNLALEDYIFRHTPLDDHFTSHRLLFYKNHNCVVIGKNQTVWKEVYLNNLAKKGYDFLRRLSGGGSVVHDLGNINYSYITSREEFDREFFNKLIIKWLAEAYPHIELELNARGDMMLGGAKVSGSAFKIAKGKAYHHGTMLINSNLTNFKGLLKPDSLDGVSWSCSSVDSVRSKVTNIAMESTQQFVDTCARGFQEYFMSMNDVAHKIPVHYCDKNFTINEDIRSTMSKLQSNEWKYLSGPNFTVNIAGAGPEISVKKGIITNSTIPNVVGLSFKEFTEKYKKEFAAF